MPACTVVPAPMASEPELSVPIFAVLPPENRSVPLAWTSSLSVTVNAPPRLKVRSRTLLVGMRVTSRIVLPLTVTV